MTNTKRIARCVGSNPKTTAELIFRLELLGCTVDRARHLRVSVDGRLRATLPSTPSCPRSVLNTVSDLRKVGIDVRRMTITEV